MYLPEYKAKEILHQSGIRIPRGKVCTTAVAAQDAAHGIDAPRYVVKAQVGAGGRGLAGGILFADTPAMVAQKSASLLGSTLVTEQTNAAGETVRQVYIEEAVHDGMDYYVGITIDQTQGCPIVLGSAEGGVDFEQKAAADPALVKTLVLPVDGDMTRVATDDFLAAMHVPHTAYEQIGNVLNALVQVFFENDAALVEINPLRLTAEQLPVVLDAKIIIDDNALFRHPSLESLKSDYETVHERIARECDINFVHLNGNIGVVVNGAGLGLATNDMLIEAGGKPANFMDIRTTTTSMQIAKAVSILLEDPAVKVILVNVHGGGMTVCDTVAEGISFAYAHSSRKLPIVFRAAGQNAQWARTIMHDRRLPHESIDTMTDAVTRAIAIAR